MCTKHTGHHEKDFLFLEILFSYFLPTIGVLVPLAQKDQAMIFRAHRMAPKKEPKPSLAGQLLKLSVDAGLGEGRYLCRSTEGSSFDNRV